MDILISPNAIIATTISGEEFRTKIRRVVSMGVNMEILAEINTLSRRTDAGELDRHGVRTELTRIGQIKAGYPTWIVVVVVGLACAGLCRLLGGGWENVALTFVASAAAMFARQQLMYSFFNPLLAVVITAFVAGLIASAGGVIGLVEDTSTSLAASVLLLVPGVHLINALHDMIRGHLITGFARGVIGALISLCIALGLLLAMQLMGVTSL
jgi:uncharacterized membrane protein YjjP (DUF1212 family)